MGTVVGYVLLAALIALGAYTAVRSFRSRSEVARDSKRRFDSPPDEGP